MMYNDDCLLVQLLTLVNNAVKEAHHVEQKGEEYHAIVNTLHDSQY